MITNRPFVVKISTKLIIQVLVAFLVMVVILFIIHYKVEAGFMAQTNTIGIMIVDCPLNGFEKHRFEIGHDNLRITEFPNYNLLYFKSGISHRLYLLLGTILFTFLFQIKIKLEIEPIRKIKESINDKLLETLVFFGLIIITTMAFALLIILRII
ncbi:MAG: hypothetical protein Q8K64_11625 [Sediminibacterium sp.]|nr:hypothetical protein [Sediminibacterium sp.]